jgi:hypothetical protein
MTVVPFPGGRSAAHMPTVNALLDELTAVEIELARARIAQIKFETRQASALWGWHCLKRAVIWGCVLWLLATLMAPARADSVNRSFYNANGSFAGSSVTRGKSTSFYNSNGSFAGTSIRHGNQTSTYDGRGRYTGSIIHTGPQRR